MLKDLTIILENKPGILADLGELLGRHNINMEALCGTPLNDESVLHIVVEDETTTKYILEQEGFTVSAIRDVIVLDMADVAGKAGSGGKLARKIGNAGVNIDTIYLAENNRIVLGVDNIDKALTALGL